MSGSKSDILKSRNLTNMGSLGYLPRIPMVGLTYNDFGAGC